MSSTYTIVTGEGGELTAGLQATYREARAAAQRHANEIGATVYLSDGTEDPDDDTDIGEAIEPETDGDAPCKACDTQPVLRTCDECGTSMMVTDCGHMAQPRPIASGRADGSDMQHTYCEDCAEVRS